MADPLVENKDPADQLEYSLSACAKLSSFGVCRRNHVKRRYFSCIFFNLLINLTDWSIHVHPEPLILGFKIFYSLSLKSHPTKKMFCEGHLIWNRKRVWKYLKHILFCFFEIHTLKWDNDPQCLWWNTFLIRILNQNIQVYPPSHFLT